MIHADFFFFHFSVDGEYDAAEIDRELISARLKQDVMDNSGKIHLFVADSVRHIRYYLHLCHSLFLIEKTFSSSLISLSLQVVCSVRVDIVSL